MNESAPRWPIKATRYSCGVRGCGASVLLTIIDPLPAGWRVIGGRVVPKNLAGAAMKIPEGKVGYVCAGCARAADEAELAPSNTTRRSA